MSASKLVVGRMELQVDAVAAVGWLLELGPRCVTNAGSQPHQQAPASPGSAQALFSPAALNELLSPAREAGPPDGEVGAIRDGT